MTFLPSKRLLVAAQNGVFFVDVPEADNAGWEKLTLLGDSANVNVIFYLRWKRSQ